MLKSFYYFLRLIVLQRHLIWSMAKRDMATQYVGSFLGVLWTFIGPLVMILIFWVVFSLGFRVQPKDNIPFVVWLTAGISAWFLFSEIVSGSATVLVANAHLIKKTLFHSQILPLVKIVSCLITHGVFLLILIVVMAFERVPMTLYCLQFLYYLFGLCILSLGLGWAVSALNAFIRDVSQIVTVILQMGFWATPVFWDIEMMPADFKVLFKLNPVFYIVQGYRDSFVYPTPFWEHPYLTAYFWGTTLVVFVIGALIFQKLKPQFADVL